MPRKKTETVAGTDSDVKENEKVLSSAETKPEKPVRRTRRSIPKENADNKTADELFFEVDYNAIDRDLSPQQQKEWTSIYASFRSKTPLSGIVIGVETHRLAVTDPTTGELKRKQIMCLVLMDFRVKIIIPQTEVWYDPATELPDYVVERMLGAKINYVITNVDREGECAIASRRMALGYVRAHFLKNSRNEFGKIQQCNILVVGPGRLIVECNGYDLQLRTREISYTAIADLRDEYKPGQELSAKLISASKEHIEISIKAVNPNPFYGAEKKHPINSIRQAIVSGSYAGGLFCRLADDTTCLCLYSPSYFTEEFYTGDSVRIVITKYDYGKKLVYGKILSKL